jgi:hypothetical protein
MYISPTNELFSTTSGWVSRGVLKELKILTIVMTHKGHRASTTDETHRKHRNRFIVLRK